jgi:tetratricopeptide (TPR) repeat protein
MKKLSFAGYLVLVTSFCTILTINFSTNSAYSQNMNSNDRASQERALKFQPPAEAKKAFESGRKSDSQNLLQEAREQYSKAIEIYPNYAEAYLARSINLTDNNAREALKDARKALEIYTARDDKNAINAVNVHIEMIERGITEGIFK